MKLEEMIQRYQTLIRLLQNEREALASDDSARLLSLREQIAIHAEKVSTVALHLDKLEAFAREQIRDRIRELQEEVTLSQGAWSRYLEELEAARQQLQSARRFVHQVKTNSAKAGRYLDQSA